ncbi:MAG: zf-HC2 domain-containing protein [Oscillospiraceae bacterium]|nr:zf-HC2 domain-containing protein [Oscillospiraceae bacterium]
MKYELPCEIVQDLLPNYIEHLTKPQTTEAVQAHLAQCHTCRDALQAMTAPAPATDAREDENLLKTLKRRLSSRQRRTVAAAIAAVLLVVGCGTFAATAPIRAVDALSICAQADVYDLHEQAAQGDTAASVTIGTDDGDDATWIVSLPQYAIRFNASDALLEESATAYRIASDYRLRSIREETVQEGGKTVLRLSDAKTSLLFGKMEQGGYQEVGLAFQALDEIRYVDADGAETVLWQK